MTESDKPEQPQSEQPQSEQPQSEQPQPTPPPPSQQPPPPYGAYPGSYPPPPPPPQSYGGYPPPPYGAYTPQATGPKNGMGIAALVIAVVALISVWSVLGGIILGIVAVIIGFIAHGRTKRGEATNGGVAIAGIALGFIAIIISLIFIPIWISFISDLGAGDYVECMQEAGTNEFAQQQCEETFRENVEDQFGVGFAP